VPGLVQAPLVLVVTERMRDLQAEPPLRRRVELPGEERVVDIAGVGQLFDQRTELLLELVKISRTSAVFISGS